MKRNLNNVRLLAAAAAVAIVGGAIAGLGGYSNVKVASAAAAAQQPAAASFVQLAIEPARIDVVAPRIPRARNVAQAGDAEQRKSL